MNGTSAVGPRWTADPKTAVTAIGEGLRALHETLPVASCPFSWTTEHRIAAVRHRADTGRLDVQRWNPTHRHLTVEAALDLLATPPPPDTVVCHGDSCAPNTLLDHQGRWYGHVDLGALGLADRWADLAIATWSTQWNYGLGWEPLLLDAYGTSADPDRIRYYRLLWDLDDTGDLRDPLLDSRAPRPATPGRIDRTTATTAHAPRPAGESRRFPN
jgi:aminoglycoside phosphotransferase